MVELIGHFHPLLVHLPIGILLLAILFELLPTWKSYRSLKRSVPTILSIGAVSALLSCITGYVLSQSGDYESDTVSWHQWSAILLTMYTIGYVWMRSRKKYKSYRKTLSFGLLILLMMTGHLGGSLTHGEDFLIAGFSTNSHVDLSAVDLKQALFYNDLVKPVLEDRCYKCHGSSKQKGKLRLDAPENIMKGGKDGKILVANNAGESEMINRMLLPLDDEDHMPPKEKPQPSPQEIEILKIWIASGADFKKSVVETHQLASLQKVISTEGINTVTDIPENKVAVADAKAMSELIELGAVVLPVGHGSNYLSANLINVSSLDSVINLLGKIKEQLVWLKVGGQPLKDNQLQKLVALKILTRLSLDHTQITDAGLPYLNSLTKLQYLNLNGNKITSNGLLLVKGLTELKSIYVYQTSIKTDEIESIKKSFPNAVIEAGDYNVPLLSSDTIEATAPATK